MISLDRIRKTFGATVAVDDVSITLGPGEIIGLVGENGAGKTTLMNLVAGELAPDSGSVEGIDPGAIGFVHQHFMIVSEFTIAENLALVRTPQSPSPLAFTPRHRQIQTAESLIAESGLSLPDVSRRADTLSVGERSKLELIKAIARRPRLLILDEPTSVLTPSEAEELFAVMRSLAARGCTVVFISHKIPEILAIASRVVILRRGRLVLDAQAGAVSATALAAAMIGPLIDLMERSASDSPPNAVLHEPETEEEIASGSPSREGTADAAIRAVDLQGATLDAVSFEVRSGSIVAIIGVAGNGQSELALIAQKLVAPRSGSLHTSGVTSFIPEDRTRDGLIAEMSIAENFALTEPRWRPREAEARAGRLIEAYDIRATSTRQPAGSLSGGNQQKVLLARALHRRPGVLVASEPTRGLDLEATRFVHQQLRAAAGRGAAILLITSDLDEAFALADAIHVIYRGRLSERLTPSEASLRAGSLMAGLG